MNYRVVFIISILGLSLAGCGGGGTAKPAQPGEDVLARIKREGVLKWGADASGGAPFVYGDPKDNNHIIGFEVDLMDKLAEHLGVKHERVQGQWEALPENLKDLRSDIVVNGFEINEIREKQFALTQPYYVYEQQITVRIEDKDKYKTLEDLKGHNIGILGGTEAGNVLTRAGFTKEQIIPHEDSKTPYDNLKLKRIDAVVAEWMIADFYAGSDKALYNNPAVFAQGKYVIMLRKEDASKALLAELDRVLKLMKENGELAAIYKKWHIWNDKQKELGIVEK